MTDRVAASLPLRDAGKTAPACDRPGATVGCRRVGSTLRGRGRPESALCLFPAIDPATRRSGACARVDDRDRAPRNRFAAASSATPGANARMAGLTRIAPGLRASAPAAPDGSLLRCPEA